MKEVLREFWMEEEGMGTVELVLIIAALIAVALIFRDQLTLYVTDLMKKVFDVSSADG